MSELPQQSQLDQFDSGSHVLPSAFEMSEQWVSQTIDVLIESDSNSTGAAKTNPTPDVAWSEPHREDWLTNARSLDLPFCPTTLLRSNNKESQTGQHSRYSSTDDYSTSDSPFQTPVNEGHLIDIAKMERVTDKTLRWLAGHSNPEVRAAVASNRKTAPETLKKLASDPDSTVRLSLVTNSSSALMKHFSSS